MQLLGAEAGREAFAKFDLWARQFTQRIEIIAADVPAADALLRRLNLPLRTPDALNLAIVRRTQSVLATFDAAMQTSAVELGIRLAEPA